MSTKIKTIKGNKYFSKAGALKWTIIGLGVAIVALWIAWFVCDNIFVSKGIKISTATSELWGIEYVTGWNWTEHWYNISYYMSIATLSLLGVYIVLLLSYMVVCGLNIKKNIKFYIYQLVASAISFIGITICIIEAAEMMVNSKWVLDITLLPPAFEVHHMDYLKWMSIAFGFTIFANVLMLCSFRWFNRHSIIRDTNLLVLVLGLSSAIMFIPFIISFGWNDKFIGGAKDFSDWIFIAQNSITWKHIVAQCITTPIGVLAGMVMVLLVIRFITVLFVYNQKWGEKKSHIIIFAIITFVMFAAFIVAHANKLDFEKLINDYNSMKLGALLVIVAQAVACLAASTYCGISHINYQRKING